MKTPHNRILVLAGLLILSALLLTACGGGNSSNNATSSSAGKSPNALANAGTVQNVEMSALVSLDGSSSSDPDGDLLTYKWKEISGTDVTNGTGVLTGVKPEFTAPASPGTLKFSLVVNDGNGDSAPAYMQVNVLGPEVTTVVADPGPNLPSDQTKTITATLLADQFTKAFEQALNSNGDQINLMIEGNVKLPIDIPGVPPGVFNGGVDVSKKVEITANLLDAGTYVYEVSFEKDAGISMGIKVPDLPAGIDVSASGTKSVSTNEVFKFSNPDDAANGMMDYLLLKALWKSMPALNAAGIDMTDITLLINNISSSITRLTGANFNLSVGQIENLLKIAQSTIPAYQAEINTAQGVLDEANSILIKAQSKVKSKQSDISTLQNGIAGDNSRIVNDCPLGLACAGDLAQLAADQASLVVLNGELDTLNFALNKAQQAANYAQSGLDAANLALNQINNDIKTYQNELAMLPPDSAFTPLQFVMTYISNGINFLNDHHSETELSLVSKTSSVAKADQLGGVNANRTTSAGISVDNKKNIVVKFKFGGEHAISANLPILSSDTGEIDETNEIKYDLTFALDPATHKYGLADNGMITLDADLKGTIAKGSDPLNRTIGAGVTPTLKFHPGAELTQFGANATGVINLSPVISVINNLLGSNATDLKNAVESTIQSFNMDNLIAAISKEKLPLTIDVYRTAGISSKLTAGNDEILTGELQLSADWNDYGVPIDLSSMTVGDFANAVFSNDGLVANVENNLITALKNAYTDLN